MKWIKLFEELNRISVTTEEKNKIREITRKAIGYLKSSKTDIKDITRIEYDLGELKTLINKDGSYFHNANGYKKVDEVAKLLSNGRGFPIIFDRTKNCFITKSGKALVAFNLESTCIEQNNPGGYMSRKKLDIYINYKTGAVVNDLTNPVHIKEFNKPEFKKDYIKVLDLTGANIHFPIEANKKRVENGLTPDVFSVLYHEFIHAKDPLVRKPVVGYDPKSLKIPGKENLYSTHDLEFQTLSNQILELLDYYFQRTLRGDKDGNGLNYGLTKEFFNNVFLPTIIDFKNFIKGKTKTLKETTMKELSGSNKNIKVIKALESLVDDIAVHPDKSKIIDQWMKDDFIRLIDFYNKKIVEINKRKPKGQELPTLVPIQS
jgi:hypothetical protein